MKRGDGRTPLVKEAAVDYIIYTRINTWQLEHLIILDK